MSSTQTDWTNVDSESLDVLLATEYRVWPIADTVVVRAGQPAPGLDWRLKNRPWVIISAFNPGGAARDPADNQEALTRLRVRLNWESGLELHPVRIVEPAGRRPNETGVLAVKPPAELVHRTVREFGQTCVAAGGPSRPTELWVYGDDWPETLPEHVQRIDI